MCGISPGFSWSGTTWSDRCGHSKRWYIHFCICKCKYINIYIYMDGLPWFVGSSMRPSPSKWSPNCWKKPRSSQALGDRPSFGAYRPRSFTRGIRLMMKVRVTYIDLDIDADRDIIVTWKQKEKERERERKPWYVGKLDIMLICLLMVNGRDV